MLVTRWLAPVVPQKEQILKWFMAEGLEPQEELLQPQEEFTDLRHPFDDVIMIAEGELILDIAGNKLLLRSGDKIVVPSNTKFSKKVQSATPCLCITAQKTF